MQNTIFRSLEEVKKRYFPNEFEKERLEEIKKVPKEYGRYLAQQSLDYMKRALQNL